MVGMAQSRDVSLHRMAARRCFRRLAKRARISDFTVGNRHDTDTQAPALRRR